MKSLTAALFLLFCGSAPAGTIPARIEANLRGRIALGELGAAVVAMVDGDKTAVEGFGAVADGAPPDGDTVFEIGSITKTFTATLLAEDVVAGKLKLEAPVKSLLPGFIIPSFEGREITLADIAEQISALPRLPDTFHPKDTADPYADYDAPALKSFLAGYKLPRAPGAAYDYSNLAVGLLGFGLAQSHDTSYGDLVAAEVLRPLGMRSSGVAPPPVPGFDAQGKPVHPWTFDALAGAGALRSTGADMLRYLEAYMGRLATPLRDAMELAAAPRREVAPRQRIGLIWMTAEDAGQPIIWHNGMTGGYASFIGFTADRKRGVVLLTNRAQSVDELGFAALSDAAPLAPARKTIELPAERLRAFAGTYRLKPKAFINILEAGGQLFARATGQPSFPLYASGADDFFAKISDIALHFERDATGRVTGLLLHQGQDFPCPKVPEKEAVAELGAIDLDAKALAAHAGTYQLMPGQNLAIRVVDGHLESQLGAQPAAALFPRSLDEFFYLATDAEISFRRDGKGLVTGLVLHQGGRDLSAPLIAP